MAWVWYETIDEVLRPAELDPRCNISETQTFATHRLDQNSIKPVYRTRASIARFDKWHCPPFSGCVAVDQLWQEIILKHVDEKLIQFVPITLIGRDGQSSRFSWLVPFSRVRCIDPLRSNVLIKKELPEITYILLCDYYVHHERCLGELNLARDEQKLSHIVLSDLLRDALATTGEKSMFYRPEDVPTVGRRQVH